MNVAPIPNPLRSHGTKRLRNAHQKFTATLSKSRCDRSDLFLLGRSQSRTALFFVLTCLIVISSIAQAAIPEIDLKQAVDTFVQSIPGSGQGATRTLLVTSSQEPGW